MVETDNKILQFLDSDRPELEITSPMSNQTLQEPCVNVQGKLFKEYFPADSKLTITVTNESDGSVVSTQTSFLKPSDLWIPNNSDSPVAEFDEPINFPTSGTYRLSCQVKNPSGMTSDVRYVWVNVTLPEGTNIIVHCHNPEGKEICSIQGTSWDSVEIYDSDELLGYGAHDAKTHYKNIPRCVGMHNVKAVFNGIIKEQEVALNLNETKVIIFVFDRVERDIQGIMTTSGGFEGSVSGCVGPSVSPYSPSLMIEEIKNGNLISRAFVSCEFAYNCHGGCQQLYWTLDSSYAWTQTPNKFICNGSASITFNPNDGGRVHAIQAYLGGFSLDVSSLFTGGLGFDEWFAQQIVPYEYDSFHIASVELMTISGSEIKLTPGNNSWNPHGYYLIRVQQQPWSRLVTYLYSSHYYLRHDDFKIDGFTCDIIASGLKFSSVPYDLTGTGI